MVAGGIPGVIVMKEPKRLFHYEFCVQPQSLKAHRFRAAYRP